MKSNLPSIQWSNERPDVAKKRKDVEIRRKGKDDHIDEIVAFGCTVHVEQMSADGWFMSITAADGSYHQFWFGSKNRKTAVEFRHTETVPAKAA